MSTMAPRQQRRAPLAREFTIGRAAAHDSDEITGVSRGVIRAGLCDLFGPLARLCERLLYRERVLDALIEKTVPNLVTRDFN